jgi:hypothetical protein
MLIARTSISELSYGDHELEARGMGLIMSMVGVSHDNEDVYQVLPFLSHIV